MELPKEFQTSKDVLWHKTNIADFLGISNTYVDELQDRGYITPQWKARSGNSLYLAQYMMWAIENEPHVKRLYTLAMERQRQAKARSD